MPKRGFMKYLFIFLTLPFFLCAYQEESNNYNDVDFSKTDSIDPDFYKKRLEIFSEGHVWVPVVYEHSQNCPCHRD